jgi:threonyl-tRNA synthetase
MDKIKIKFPDDSNKEFDKGISGFEIAKSISSRLADEALAIEVNGEVKDLNSKLNEDSSIKILTFNDDDGKEVYWHSSSHLMAHAIKSIYPEAKFGVGPAIDNGFYYDFDINTKLGEDDLNILEDKMMEIAKFDNKFERVELSKQNAIDLFSKKQDQYKLEILNEIDENNETISIYNEGDFTDLCTGPHLPSAGKIKYVKLLSVSGSYWRGDEKQTTPENLRHNFS